jgi:hypothetical protein
MVALDTPSWPQDAFCVDGIDDQTMWRGILRR